MRTTNRIAALVFVAVLLLTTGLFGGGRAEEPTDGSMRIVTTTGHLADMVRNIAPDAEVTELLGPGTDPHTYVPSTREVQMLQTADLVFWNGLELEIQFTDTLAALGDHAVEVARKLPRRELLEFAGHGHDHDDDHGHDEGHGPDHDDDNGHDGDNDDDNGHGHDNDHGEHDPHVWFDLGLWIHAVEIVTDHIVAFDPANEETYRSNAAGYIAQLEELDEYAHDRFAEIPGDRRVLVTGHDAFGYLAHRYGLETRGVFGLSTEDEAGIRDIEELAEFVSDRGIPVIFQETIVDDQAPRALREAVAARGGSVMISTERLYSDALGDSGETATFIGAFRHNVDTIVDALTADG